LEALNGTRSVFSFLYLNVHARFARKFVKIESEHFADCGHKILSFVVCRGASA